MTAIYGVWEHEGEDGYVPTREFPSRRKAGRYVYSFKRLAREHSLRGLRPLTKVRYKRGIAKFRCRPFVRSYAPEEFDSLFD